MSDTTDFDKLWDYDHPDVSEARFRDALSGVSEDDTRLQIMTQIARAQGLGRHFDAAHETLDSVARDLEGKAPLTRVRYLLERGRVFNSARVPEKACPFFQEALDLAETTSLEFYAADAAHMLGIAAPPADQLSWNLKALTLAESATSERARGWLGSLYNNIGWTYHDRGEYAAALTTFEKGLAWQQAHGAPRNIHIARWCIARTLRSLNQIDAALTLLRSLDSEGDGYVEEEIGECLLTQGQAENARPAFASAYTKLSGDPWLVANEPDRLRRLAALGGIQPTI
jgi:tetratricopeptide (TPR) repeat protein